MRRLILRMAETAGVAEPRAMSSDDDRPPATGVGAGPLTDERTPTTPKASTSSSSSPSSSPSSAPKRTCVLVRPPGGLGVADPSMTTHASSPSSPSNCHA